MFRDIGIGVFVATAWPLAQQAVAADSTEAKKPVAALVAEIPDIKVNDYWVYRNKDLNTQEESQPYRVVATKVTDSDIQLRTGRRMETATRELNVVDRTFDGKPNLKVEPSDANLRFPLEVGKKWDAIGRNHDFPNDRVVRWTGKGEVERIETITVPAGTFETFRVSFLYFYTTTNRSGDVFNGTVQSILWYAPAVKRWVKSLRTNNIASYGGSGYNDRQTTELQSCSQNCSKSK